MSIRALEWSVLATAELGLVTKHIPVDSKMLGDFFPLFSFGNLFGDVYEILATYLVATSSNRLLRFPGIAVECCMERSKQMLSCRPSNTTPQTLAKLGTQRESICSYHQDPW